jgi:hypothetical protein
MENELQPVEATEPTVTEEKPAPREYRELSEEEQEMLFAQYDSNGGKVTYMLLDKDVLFKGMGQLYYYVHKYDFETKLVDIRKKRALEVMSSLQDSKIEAIQRAQQLLGVHYQILRTKGGVEIMDEEGNPIVVETLPHFKEIKTAWEIIKTELGEPTSITKGSMQTDNTLKIEGAREIAAIIQSLDDEQEQTESTPPSI